jgi:hypothetical protein
VVIVGRADVERLNLAVLEGVGERAVDLLDLPDPGRLLCRGVGVGHDGDDPGLFGDGRIAREVVRGRPARADKTDVDAIHDNAS